MQLWVVNVTFFKKVFLLITCSFIGDMHYSRIDQSDSELDSLPLSGSRIIIAIDGYSSCGKSTTAKRVADRLSYRYIDTGAMYRAVALYFLDKQIELYDVDSIRGALNNITISFHFNVYASGSDTYLNGVNVEHEIRSLHVANLVSKVSAIPQVRRVITEQQVGMGKERGIVMDGRDIGTHVFPDAELKVFMTADPLIRAQRRQMELISKGQIVDLAVVIDNIKSRDYDDTTRVISPLLRANDAILLDTSFLTVEEQIDWVAKMAIEKISVS